MSAVSLLSAEARARIDREVRKYPADQKQSAVMAALAIAQDDQPRRRNALGQHLPAQHRGVKGLQLRMQRGDDAGAMALLNQVLAKK